MSTKKQDLITILGARNIEDEADTLEAYASDESFVHPMRPRFVVKVQNATQVEKLVAWANLTSTPLVPVSSGPPRFRGDTVPSTPGAVVVDLSGMRKIIRIDPRNRMIIIEPGVTYTQLQPELAKAGLRLSSPIAPRANKSVIASRLEREPITIPRLQWNPLDPLRCLEVVWGDGQRITTGEAEGVGTLEEEWAMKLAQVSPNGPAQTDFYRFTSAAQGSMGIATWASLKCEQLPQLHELFFVPAPKLDALIDMTYDILRIRFGDELLILNNRYLASLLGKDNAEITTLSGILPKWVLLIAIAGRERMPQERLAYQEQDISEIAQKYGLQLLKAVPGASGDQVLKAVLNPSPEPYWKQTFKGACQDIFFLTTLEKTPCFITAMDSTAEEHAYPTSDIGVYIQPVHQGANCHIEFSLPYDCRIPAEMSRMETLYKSASAEMLKAGAYYSRPYGIWADMAFNGDARSVTALKKIKAIFDPNNIMNPGKLCF